MEEQVEEGTGESEWERFLGALGCADGRLPQEFSGESRVLDELAFVSRVNRSITRKHSRRSRFLRTLGGQNGRERSDPSFRDEERRREFLCRLRCVGPCI